MSLHWILMLTLTLLRCLTAKPIKAETLRTIGRLQEHNCNEPDSKFYSPSGTNECIKEALKCSVLELDKVATECFESGKASPVYRTRDSIKILLNGSKATHKDCLCKNNKPEEKTYKEFLDNLLKLVQMHNSQSD